MMLVCLMRADMWGILVVDRGGGPRGWAKGGAPVR